jgi:hypothetical protein
MLIPFNIENCEHISDYQDTWYHHINCSMRINRISTNIYNKIQCMINTIIKYGTNIDNIIIYRGASCFLSCLRTLLNIR